MARSMRVCVKQRQMTPDMACWICASLARGLRSSSALAVRTTPLRQKPHCAACSSMKAFCSGCGCSMVPMPASVVTSFCPTALTGVMQERIAWPFMMTVQAPHWPSPQPSLGPLSWRSSLSTYSSGVEGSTSTVWLRPSTFRLKMLIVLGGYDEHKHSSRATSCVFRAAGRGRALGCGGLVLMLILCRRVRSE